VDWGKHLRRVHAAIGVEATLNPAVGGAIAVRGMLTRAFVNAPIGEVGAADSTPVFDAMLADIPNVAYNDQLLVGGVHYIVRGVEPDQPSGLVRLRLQLSE
jgi:hypothetical protein